MVVLTGVFWCVYRLQVVDDTRAKQLDAWRDLVVAWAKANRANKLTLSDFPYWHNKKLKRMWLLLLPPPVLCVGGFLLLYPSQCNSSLSLPGKLTAEGINAVAEHVIQSGTTASNKAFVDHSL